MEETIKKIDEAAKIMEGVGSPIERTLGENNNLTFRADTLYNQLLELAQDVEDANKKEA